MINSWQHLAWHVVLLEPVVVVHLGQILHPQVAEDSHHHPGLLGDTSM